MIKTLILFRFNQFEIKEKWDIYLSIKGGKLITTLSNPVVILESIYVHEGKNLGVKDTRVSEGISTGKFMFEDWIILFV